MKISIILGFANDYSKIKEACDFFKKTDVEFELRALSAHRTGEELEDYIRVNDESISLYIAAAGKAAHQFWSYSFKDNQACHWNSSQVFSS